MRRGRHDVDPGYVAATLLLIVGAWAALSVDVVRAGFGVKGDEATYVAMALSAAYDADLAYQRGDLERFYEVYHAGPEGIFLKLPGRLDLDVEAGWPFARIGSVPIAASDHLYFGKAYIHAVLAAPFVRLAGLNGLLLFHVLLMVAVFLAAYRFLAALSPPSVALPYALAFFGVSIVPLYIVWLTPEIFNVAFVFLAYFFWFYKEVAPPATHRLGRWARGPASDVIAALLLGLATFSKIPNAVLIGAPVVWLWWQRRFRAGLMTGMVFGIVVVGAFGINALITGDIHYQGGARRTYYSGAGGFPLQGPDVGFADAGIPVSTNEVTIDEPLGDSGLRVLARNAWYFLVGRHFGFVPFFFPGVVTLALALWRWRTLRLWHLLILGAAVVAAGAMLFLLPYSWSGGGGPSGNRYFLSIYPVLLFLTPPMTSLGPAAAAWFGGALFTAQILVNPFVSAKQTYLAPQRGAFRWLPVELTMVNDLPVRLDTSRQRIPFGDDPTVLLYFLDENAWLPEAPGVWIAGKSRSDIIVRTDVALAVLEVTLEAPIRNRVTIDAGRGAETVEVEPGRSVTVIVDAGGVSTRQGWACVLTVRTEEGFVPRLLSPDSDDPRFLGVAVKLAGKVFRPAH